jgi:hypothetical protein
MKSLSVLASLFTCLICGCASPTAPSSARIVWFGTLEGAAAPIPTQTESSGAEATKEANEAVMTDRTDLVPLELGVRFGIQLEPQAGPSQPKKYTVRWRLPAPGVPHPTTGVLRREDSWESDTQSCMPRCRILWQFDVPAELILGEWSVEVEGFGNGPIVRKFHTYRRPTREPASNLKTLTYDDAVRLVSTPSFASARQSALLRPRPLVEIRSLRLLVSSDNEGTPVTSHSTMRFRPLPGGLQYSDHVLAAREKMPGLEEAFISVYGAVNVLYWNGTHARGGGFQISTPPEVSVAEGKVFDKGSAFVVRDSMTDGSLRTRTCRPVEQLPASAIHPKLPGTATVFACEDIDPAFVSTMWYVHSAEAYFMRDVRVGGKLQSRFEVLDVELGSP